MQGPGSDTAGQMKIAVKPVMDAILLGQRAEAQRLAGLVAQRFNSSAVVAQAANATAATATRWKADDTAEPKPASPASIKTVHMVSMCHLDVGFTDTVAGVVNKYWHSYFPQAANTSRLMNQQGKEKQFVFTTHAWLLDLFFDCPTTAFQPTVGTRWFDVCGQPGDPSAGVDSVCDVGCPSEELKQTVEDAIRAGGIAWHAYVTVLVATPRRSS